MKQLLLATAVSFSPTRLGRCWLLLLILLTGVNFSGAQSAYSGQFGFIENKGQVIDQNNNPNPSVKYILNLPGINVQLKKNGFSYDTYTAVVNQTRDGKVLYSGMEGAGLASEMVYKIHRIDIAFIGASETPDIIAENQGNGYINYYTAATAESGVTGVRHFNKITYKNLYKGIDLEFISRPGATKPVEYNFIVHPGADVSAIKWKYDGSLETLLQEGAISITTIHGNLAESIPHSYEKTSGNPVKVSYLNLGNGVYGFDAKTYSKQEALIIDPVPHLSWGTYFGGSDGDIANKVAVDTSSNVYYAGATYSANNIATTGAHQATRSTGPDATLAKFSSAGVCLWATYYGGTGDDQASNLGVDASGNVYMWGSTNTSSSAIMSTAGAHQTTLGGGVDGFLVKFNTSGVRQWGTYYGGTGEDRCMGGTIDPSGNVYVGGRTSTNAAAGIISTASTHQPAYGGGTYDGYVAKFNTSGVRQWATYYGGTGEDHIYAMCSDASGNIFPLVYTKSTNGIATPGAYKTAPTGTNYEAAVVKMDGSGVRQWGTYYGGANEEIFYAGAADASGNIYLTGYTTSTVASDISTPGAHQPNYGGGNYDAFVTKFDGTGMLCWGTYYGGSAYDAASSIAVDNAANAYMIFSTQSQNSSNNLATPGAFQTVNKGSYDIGLVKLDSSGKRIWGTLYGGTGDDRGLGIAVDMAGTVFIGGSVGSNAGIVTTGAHQATFAGGSSGRFGIPAAIDALHASFVNCGGFQPITADFLVPDTVYLNAPVKFANINPQTTVDYSWYIDNVNVANTQDFTNTFTTLGTFTLALAMENCQYEDSTSKTITVYPITSIPYPDFFADKNVVNPFEPVQFYDLTRYGVTDWKWTVYSPTGLAFFNNEFIQQPEGLFYDPGYYEICLEVTNDHGTVDTCKSAYILVREELSLCYYGASQTITAPAGHITDDNLGAGGNYANNSNCNLLIDPCATEINMVFNSVSLADNGDMLKIYDGSDNTGTLLATIIGPFTGIPGGANGYKAVSGKMYLEWVTNASGQAAGFDANYGSIPGSTLPPPTASFDIPDSIFTGKAATFTSTSTGTDITYIWDFDPPTLTPGLNGGNKSTDSYVWNTSGTYPVELRVSNCGGRSRVTRNVVVHDRTHAPSPRIFASRTKIAKEGIIQLFDSSYQAPTAWRWEITPATGVIFLTGNTSQHPVVQFNTAGNFDVKLVATNNIGSDSVVYSSYILVLDYCKPGVSILNPDIGISRVKLGSLDNQSTIGASGYTNYSNTIAPVLLYKGGEYTITVERSTFFNSMSRKVWIDWNTDGDFDDAGELVAFEQPANTHAFTATVKVDRATQSGNTIMRVGTSYSNYNNSPCGVNPIGEFEDYALLIKDDDIQPVITLTGNDTVYIEQWHQYVDAGAHANDNIDGILNQFITVNNTVDSSVVGTYYVKYNVMDTAGNQATEKVRVVIITPDITAPEITLAGQPSVKHRVKTTYADAGAVAMDYFNRDISALMVKDSSVDENVLGTYYYWYTVADGNGNTDSVARMVEVIDDVAPVLTLAGNDTIEVEVFSNINDPGINAADNYYAGVNWLADSSKVNISVTGYYVITYSATDSSGNTSVITRTVKVQDTELPVVNLIGSDTVIIDVNTDYFEQGAKVSDNYCKGLLWDVDTVPDTRVIGEYLLTYSATDCENNTALPVTRVVKVVDRIAPVLYLKGLPAVITQRWVPYNDAGVKITDNYYDSATLSGLLVINSNIDYVATGTYSICYEVTDPSGNTSNQVCRVVTVVENTTSVNEPGFKDGFTIYPNPNRGIFTISLKNSLTESTEVTITDMLGRQVHSTFINAGTLNKDIDLENMGAGMYQVVLNSGFHTATFKITIVR